MLRLMLSLILGCLSFVLPIEAYQNPKPEYLLLITGCARCGTTYISQVLNKCGLDVPHEKMGAHGTVNWIMAVPADYTPMAYDFRYCCAPGLNHYRFQHIFHQVRDPLKSISSIAVDLDPIWDFVGGYIQEVDMAHPTIINAARYWYYWNLKAEKIAEWTYRIEDIDHVWKEFCRRLGYPLDKSNLKRVQRNTNSGKVSHRVTWKALKRMLEPELYNNIVKMARRYGYSVTDKN